jgi:Fe-S-cluster containining protein
VKPPTATPLNQSLHLRLVIPALMQRADLQAAVAAVMSDMERAYDKIASHYGFVCRGCEQSCCRTVFYHHTYAEFMLLETGLRSLQRAAFKGVLERALEAQACLERQRVDTAAGALRVMCPLNQAGRCLLYAQRPMICRLHGIPHRLRRPDGHLVSGPGCHQFDALSAEALRPKALCGEAGSRRLDRTPFYQRLAQVEQQLRQRIETPMRLKMTLAEWLSAQAVMADEDVRFSACSLGP